MRICLDLTIDQEEDAKMEPLKLLFLSKDENRWRQTDVSGKLSRPFFFKDLEKEVNRIWSSAEETRSESILNSMHFLCAEDNELGRETPIIAMTANAFEEDRKKAFAAGMDGHIAKPVDMQVLFTTLEQIIGAGY